MNTNTEPRTLLLTQTGSKLYGFNHAGSDNDMYRVTETLNNGKKTNIRQVITGNDDILTLDFKTFAMFAYNGQMQALEAMFSPIATIDHLQEFRNSFYAGLNQDSMIGQYRKAITKFAHGDFKKRRHALRLASNLDDAMKFQGRFNPRLDAERIAEFTAMANSFEYCAFLQSLTIYDLHLNTDEIMDTLRTELKP